MYLLDTHAIIWYVTGNNELSPIARNIMETKRCFFSYVSLWEIAIKQAKGTLQFDIDIPRLKSVLENEEFVYLPTTEYDAERIKTLPDIHKDPFDRLLIAQSIENGLIIVTTDSKIPLYNVKTIW
ncbi:type II toxin-antitoxin system VapC family toxin [uncultured Treponema sp.]|uniref:type II toxin-antitoxin system VapC family toxin n=1 Tax=uncultured Treponema sp. TaxID=162155 RepID=UPI0026FF76FE|nr:type II toxin-antitoxin system VapC family toxin [uncultured Treponema sp.]MDO5773577.1 type II toxin-antitoxin system VapC family toxin [Spirochaetales bacterium]